MKHYDDGVNSNKIYIFFFERLLKMNDYPKIF